LLAQPTCIKTVCTEHDINNLQQQHSFSGPLSETIWVSRYQKGKTNPDLLEQKTVSGSGISWAICKSTHRPRHITTPAPHHSLFTIL